MLRSTRRTRQRTTESEPDEEHRLSPDEEKFLHAMGALSQQLQTATTATELSLADVDVIALRVCGRRWCDFVSEADYRATIDAVKDHVPTQQPTWVQTTLHLC